MGQWRWAAATPVKYDRDTQEKQQNGENSFSNLHPLSWMSLNHFSPWRYFPIFNFQNTRYLDDITFIFDRCHCSSAEDNPDNMKVIQSIQTT